MPSLFDTVDLHGLTLTNRIAMAPLTRSRANDGDVPGQHNATYYGQRASAGLIITEATNITPMSCAFERAPGIYNNTRDPNPAETCAAVASMLDEYGVAYLHLADTNAWAGQPDMPRIPDYPTLAAPAAAA
jgi:2,4-dienoyl-CoA reductase-like NADH-dependent reductase (Old Yellow Enzyme family)